jgi:hypothetical protein
MQKAAMIFCLVVAGSIATAASANKPAAPKCWFGDNDAKTVQLSQPYTVSASGLPAGGQLNLRVYLPNGNVLTSPITATDGSYWAETSVEQAGDYTYEFVGKVSWPSGQTNKVYTACSMQAS